MTESVGTSLKNCPVAYRQFFCRQKANYISQAPLLLQSGRSGQPAGYLSHSAAPSMQPWRRPQLEYTVWPETRKAMTALTREGRFADFCSELHA